MASLSSRHFRMEPFWMTVDILPQRVFLSGICSFYNAPVQAWYSPGTWATLWGTATNLPDPTQLTVWWRRRTPPGHHACVTCVSSDQASAAEEKHGVFGELIGVTWGQRQLGYTDRKAEHT